MIYHGFSGQMQKDQFSEFVTHTCVCSLVSFQMRTFGINFFTSRELTLVNPSSRVGWMILLSLRLFGWGRCYLNYTQTKNIIKIGIFQLRKKQLLSPVWFKLPLFVVTVVVDAATVVDAIVVCWKLAFAGLIWRILVTPKEFLEFDSRTIVLRVNVVPLDTRKIPWLSIIASSGSAVSLIVKFLLHLFVLLDSGEDGGVSVSCWLFAASVAGMSIVESVVPADSWWWWWCDEVGVRAMSSSILLDACEVVEPDLMIWMFFVLKFLLLLLLFILLLLLLLFLQFTNFSSLLSESSYSSSIRSFFTTTEQLIELSHDFPEHVDDDELIERVSRFRSFRSSSKHSGSTFTLHVPEIGPGAVKNSHGIRSLGSVLNALGFGSSFRYRSIS